MNYRIDDPIMAIIILVGFGVLGLSFLGCLIAIGVAVFYGR